ncbi:MAG: heme-copper oxidase subunit III [SAR202 cluster bacterium]|jgi:cytochrome c oxidase subunit 3|nr:cytochrome c oxidase subunit 3 [SAR202 cluster bacterium]MQG46670.1 heme-copper oxidase subunit III [SAR202 cluster bacterium]
MSTHASEITTKLQSLTVNRLGLWLFLVSDASFFVALISSRFFVYGTDTPSEINQFLGLGLTVLLLLSSLTAYRAEAGAESGNRTKMTRNILLTIVIGVIFLVGVGFEWYIALGHEVTWPSKPYGTVLFTLTGVHATHVLTGLLALAVVYFLKRKSIIIGPENSWAVEGAVKYWHLVDVAWVFIYPTLYLVN